MSNKFNPKKNNQDRRIRPKVHPSLKQEAGPNHKERRLLKARERMLPSFSRKTRMEYADRIDRDAHRVALLKPKVKVKKTKKPFISKRSLKAKKK